MHHWDQFERAKSLSTRHEVILMVVRRANKPLIRSRLPFTSLLQDVLDNEDEDLFKDAPGMPWTMEFTRTQINKEFKDHAWITEEPYNVEELPYDAESSDGTLWEIAQRENLAGEVHQPFSRRAKGYGRSAYRS
ncbi:hypothetical protein CSAL01_13707 [Colletotrichum salicis]|uniref:Uncharacterized protein n=1 Tax=Colletotrichum salicis TaxID=1209931 RepID=A0A135S0D3_9PEZI|nr:hypothetical protein CSAL01_13707 [Colletotrichum salicis]